MSAIKTQQTTKTQQFDFLTTYILGLLDHLNLGDMTEEQRQAYIPRLIHEVEFRLGEKFVSQLDPKYGDEFAALLEREDAKPEEWGNFWKKSIPNFEEQVQEALAAFAEECEEILKR